MRFMSGDHWYSVDRFGVVHQDEAKPFRYDAEYVGRYDTPRYRDKSSALSCLRLGWVLGICGARSVKVQSILDVGFGDGSFMKEAAKAVPRVFGNEVAPVPAPEGCEKVCQVNGRHYDVVTFWDSLEHHPSMDFLKTLDCDIVAISVPWCHEYGGEWFSKWKHRKPDEHLHHFSNQSLSAFMNSVGWFVVAQGNHEDVVRAPFDGQPNILSMAFSR